MKGLEYTRNGVAIFCATIAIVMVGLASWWPVGPPSADPVVVETIVRSPGTIPAEQASPAFAPPPNLLTELTQFPVLNFPLPPEVAASAELIPANLIPAPSHVAIQPITPPEQSLQASDVLSTPPGSLADQYGRQLAQQDRIAEDLQQQLINVRHQLSATEQVSPELYSRYMWLNRELARHREHTASLNALFHKDLTVNELFVR